MTRECSARTIAAGLTAQCAVRSLLGTPLWRLDGKPAGAALLRLLSVGCSRGSNTAVRDVFQDPYSLPSGARVLGEKLTIK